MARQRPERARRHLARLDPIADSDEDDDTIAPVEDELQFEESNAPNEASSSSSSDASSSSAKSVSQPDPYLKAELDRCWGY